MVCTENLTLSEPDEPQECQICKKRGYGLHIECNSCQGEYDQGGLICDTCLADLYQHGLKHFD